MTIKRFQNGGRRTTDDPVLGFAAKKNVLPQPHSKKLSLACRFQLHEFSLRHIVLGMKLNNSAVPVYTVAGSETSRNLPDWLTAKKKKKDPEYANKVELLQDFSFEEASQCIRVSEDGEWVMSTGTYKPQIHTHYLPNLSLSWARHTDTLNKTFLLLSSDCSKSAHLQEDRSIELHTPGGCHYSIRIPRYGRDLVYDRSTAELLVPSVGVNANAMGEVFRINLEVGRFMNEFQVDVGGDDMMSSGGGALQGGIRVGGVNTAAIAGESHNLYAFGTTIGTVEYWDPRSRSRAATLIIPQDLEGRSEITALAFHRSGIDHAVGTSSGMVYLYDLRSPLATLKKDQGYGFAIQHVEFLTPSSRSRLASSEPKILSGDKRILKIWEQHTGEPWTSIEPAVDMNCVAWCKDSGMILTANEGQQQHAFFVPQLGPAPRWCAFLDNIVEEMADDPSDPYSFATRKTGEVYDNYKFLTVSQLRTLSLDHLIGKTNLLRPYMHGYFVAQRLYEEARLVTNPSSWEEERAKRVQEKIDKERESRIRGKTKIKAAKVNRKLVEKILEREEQNERKRVQRVLAQGGDVSAVHAELEAAARTDEQEGRGILNDTRFAALFEDEEFVIDETSKVFQQLNPSTIITRPSNLDHEKGLTAVEEELVDSVPNSSADEASSDESTSRRQNGASQIAMADYKRRPRKSQKQQHRRLDSTHAMGMRVSSSNSNSKESRLTGGRYAGERSFATRAHNLRGQSTGSSRLRKPTGTAVYGNKTVTFEPGGTGKSGRANHVSNFDQMGPRSSKDRRSASGNTFRRM